MWKNARNAVTFIYGLILRLPSQSVHRCAIIRARSPPCTRRRFLEPSIFLFYRYTLRVILFEERLATPDKRFVYFIITGLFIIIGYARKANL